MPSSGSGLLTPARAGVYVFLVAVAAYANSLGNGFALDDNLIVVANPVVTEGRWAEALFGPYWYGAREGGGLYRPVTLLGFALEWRLWGGSALGYHAVSVLGHALVTLGVLRLLGFLVPLAAALAGAVLFAVHPVHVEAVANVVGRSEVYVALATLGAAWAHLSPRLRKEGRRGIRLALVCALFLLGLGSKEGAVVLPGVLLLLEVSRRSDEPLARRLVRDLPLWVGLAAVLVAYLALRVSVLGAVTGGGAAPELLGVSTAERTFTALTLWPEYLRLLLFPVALSADYAPAVLVIHRAPDVVVASGLFTLMGLAVLAVASRRRVPLVTLGVAWFFVTVLPVSNLLFPAGILLAERTLYLPSVSLSLAVAGGWVWAAEAGHPRLRRWGPWAAAVVGLALLARTVDRNPSWFSTYTVMNTLARDHPESALALRTRAIGLERVGERQASARIWRTVLALQPNHYGFLVEAARFFDRIGERTTASSLLDRARALRPDDPSAYRTQAEVHLRRGEGRDAHRVALEGLARAGSDAELWALVSESYIAKGDLDASLRARRAALGADPGQARNWERLADVLDALGRSDEAGAARARAAAVGDGPAGTPDRDVP